MEGIALREGMTATLDRPRTDKICLVLAGYDDKERPFNLRLSPAEKQALWSWWEKAEQQALSESS